MADTKTLDEHAETVKRLDAVDARLAEVFGPRPESVRAVRDAYETERKARMAAESRVRELEASEMHLRMVEVVDRDLLDASKAAERAQKAEARVRELEAERAGLVTAEAYGQATAALAEDLAATRAQLARLREAAEAVMLRVDEDAAVTLGSALGATTGPTLAEIRRAAQVEVLRDAVDTACDAVLAAVPCCNGTAAVHAVRRSLEKRADDLEAGR